MQIRIWSELIVGNIHSSLDDPPTSAMFLRAGKNTKSVKKKDNDMAEAFTQAAVAISSALSPPRTTSSTLMSGGSPAKLIEARSKCYKQLHDLGSLKDTGVLSESEYFTEKKAVLGVLRKLNGE